MGVQLKKAERQPGNQPQRLLLRVCVAWKGRTGCPGWEVLALLMWLPQLTSKTSISSKLVNSWTVHTESNALNTYCARILLSKSPLDSVKPSASHFYCTKEKQIISEVLHSASLDRKCYLKPFSLFEFFYRTPSSFCISYFNNPVKAGATELKNPLTIKPTHSHQPTVRQTRFKIQWKIETTRMLLLILPTKIMSQLWLYSAWSTISSHSTSLLT